jgi:hypothetical protein
MVFGKEDDEVGFASANPQLETNYQIIERIHDSVSQTPDQRTNLANFAKQVLDACECNVPGK